MNFPLFHKSQARANALALHLKSWGLRCFSDESSYYQWQKDELTREELTELHRLSLARRGGKDPLGDMDFYELAARSHILPVLYSQRYEYYLEIGCAITDRIKSAQRVLDFGCGVGILTTFYAHCFPHITFVGIDRSQTSIARASAEARKLGLSNVRFEHGHLPFDSIFEKFDLIISTHTLFQAEHDPGLPSLSWKTFERAHDPAFQAQAEERNGLKGRLDSLTPYLSAGGRLLLCEKAQHLGRRILLQRALARRGYYLVSEPMTFHYRAIDEVIDDGPLYEVSQEPGQNVVPFHEEPTPRTGESLYSSQGQVAKEFFSCLTGSQFIHILELSGNPSDATTVTLARWGECLAYAYVQSHSGFRGLIIGALPDEVVLQRFFTGAEKWSEAEQRHALGQLWPQPDRTTDKGELPNYENHTSTAHNIWNSLPNRKIQDQATFQEDHGREMHIERGNCGLLAYLYWANTYDQRQLVLMTGRRAKEIQDYYHESLAEMRTEPPGNNPTGKARDLIGNFRGEQ